MIRNRYTSHADNEFRLGIVAQTRSLRIVNFARNFAASRAYSDSTLPSRHASAGVQSRFFRLFLSRIEAPKVQIRSRLCRSPSASRHNIAQRMR